jgi:hypothetical protein
MRHTRQAGEAMRVEAYDRVARDINANNIPSKKLTDIRLEIRRQADFREKRIREEVSSAINLSKQSKRNFYGELSIISREQVLWVYDEIRRISEKVLDLEQKNNSSLRHRLQHLIIKLCNNVLNFSPEPSFKASLDAIRRIEKTIDEEGGYYYVPSRRHRNVIPRDI